MKPVLFVSALVALFGAGASSAAGLTPADDACDDPAASSAPGAIQEVRDVNGDGRPEAVLTEGGTFCYGHTGAGYSLVSKQANGRWIVLTKGVGILSFLPSKGAGGWPDIEIGGPGFCFPVERWNGRAYVLHRHQYEGKACRP